ncbi:HD domain-containing protein [Streptomyces violaceus]|uniref:HD domain-containing protein n=1 Tax=Streptomyces violaceus TaxID=1936 RepID=A0ABZ1NKQ7_STRVL
MNQTRFLSVGEVDALAAEAHAGQVDKIGVPYIEHVRAVAAGLAPISAALEQAGLLHDIIEDTDWTAERLLDAGVSLAVVETVQAVTRTPDIAYMDMIRSVAADPIAALVKIADNAHNSLPSRAASLPDGKRESLAKRYAAARRVLWPAVQRHEVEGILRRVNPSLLSELEDA